MKGRDVLLWGSILWSCVGFSAHEPPRRGVWIASVDSDVLDSSSNIRRAFEDLKARGFNAAYPVVWNKGAIFFRDEKLEHLLEEMPYLPDAYQGRDPLRESVREGERQGLEVVPWFEYGLKVPADVPLFQKHSEWFLKKRNGTQTDRFGKYDVAYLNPLRADVQHFFVTLFSGAARIPGVKAIQLDDHWGYPPSFGYDETTVGLYRAEHKGKDPPQDINDPTWMRWRAEKLTQAWTHIRERLRAEYPQVRVILAPNIARYAYALSLQDWVNWVRRGTVDEVILQNYKYGIEAFREELKDMDLQELRSQVPVSLGLLAGVSVSVNAAKILKGQMEAACSFQYEGWSFFHYPFLVGGREESEQADLDRIFPEVWNCQ